MHHGHFAQHKVPAGDNRRTSWGQYKLTPEQRQDIRFLADEGLPYRFIADAAGVDVTTVWAIVNGKGSYGKGE